jgi:hypothetical protein
MRRGDQERFVKAVVRGERPLRFAIFFERV